MGAKDTQHLVGFNVRWNAELRGVEIVLSHIPADPSAGNELSESVFVMGESMGAQVLEAFRRALDARG
jgi:hypothetical protein